MARSRKDAKDCITSLSPQIVTHLVKLFVFNSPENKNHWIKEIDGWLNQIDDIYLKPSDKKPDWQTIYNWIIFDSSPHYDAEYIDGRVRKWLETDYENVSVYDYDADVVLNELLKIIERVSQDISIPNKFISINNYLGVRQ
jgi:hypothetical protein